MALRPTPPRPTAAAVRVPLVESFYPTGPAGTVAHEDAPPPDETRLIRGKVAISADDLKEVK